MKSSEHGFSSGVMVASLAAIGMTVMFVSQQSQKTTQTIKEAGKREASLDTNNLHLSNLALLKGALQPAKRGTRYVPSLYPTDYFAQNWALEQNKDAPSKGIATSGSLVKLTAMNGSVLDPKELALINEGPVKPVGRKKSQQEMKIYHLDYDKTATFWVRSVDVNSKISADSSSSTANGRISLDAPRPFDLKIAIKAPGASDFKIYSKDDNLPETDNPSGTYTFKVLGSGVVLYSEVTIDGVPKQLGIDVPAGKVLHQARNINAKDASIGEFEVKLEAKTTTSTSTSTSSGGGGGATGVGTPGEGGSGGGDGCQIGADNAYEFSQGVGSVGGSSGVGGVSTTSTTTTTTEPKEVSVSVKLYGVDGQEVTDLSFKKSFTVGKKESKSSTTTTGIATQTKSSGNCSEYCPMNSVTDFDNDIENMALALDRGAKTEADYRKVDFFNPNRTVDTLDTSKVPGIICDNFDLAGKAMYSNTGLLASVLLHQDKTKYMANWNQYKTMFQSYIYIAPKCNRTVINQRTTCGCFAEDSLILMADGTERPIRDLRQGDYVWNPKVQKAFMIRKVVAGPEKIPMYEVKTKDNTVVVTHGHPFLTSEGLRTAKALSQGDLLIKGDKSIVIESVTELAVPEPAPVVWNIELDASDEESDHYVMANGIMTGDLYLQQRLDSK